MFIIGKFSNNNPDGQNFHILAILILKYPPYSGLSKQILCYEYTRSRDLNSKVELFNVFFHSVYSKSTIDVKLLATDVVNPNLLFEVTTTAPELEGILSKINVNKAPGVDNLPARILHTCAKELCIPLAHLFNLSPRTGKMPTLWKSANITPIHKGDSRELVTNYRSISLLPIPAKCLEHNCSFCYL